LLPETFIFPFFFGHFNNIPAIAISFHSHLSLSTREMFSERQPLATIHENCLLEVVRQQDMIQLNAYSTTAQATTSSSNSLLTLKQSWMLDLPTNSSMTDSQAWPVELLAFESVFNKFTGL
jgi:hypothetical protein